MLEYIILGFLMYGGKSGYELKQRMTYSTSYFFDASFGSIYPALKRLEQKGLIVYRESVEGSKYKKVYQIQESGKVVFLNWLEKPIIFEKARQDHLVQIFFYEFLSKEKAIENLKMFVEEVGSVANQLNEQKEEATAKHSIYQFYYRYSTMLYGIDYYRFVTSWCNELIHKLETDPQTAQSECFRNI
jgi:DNA-binding PadR family transcriptional regulator